MASTGNGCKIEEDTTSDLPITSYKEEIILSIRSNPCVIVTGETGCGKTTQLPQYLHEHGFSKMGQVGVTQPRRMAAVSVAHRVSREMKCTVGGTVGYRVRFDDCTGPDTKIKYLTDGCLLRELLDDPQLTKYSVIVLDEAHERSLSTDILFGLTKQLLDSNKGFDSRRKRPLQVVIMSATLDVNKFSAFFNSCPIYTIPGRVHPVKVHYCCTDEGYDSSISQPYLSQVIRVVMDIHLDHPAGDILVFLTGQHEIETTCDKLFKEAEGIDYGYDVQCKEVRGLAILPLYGSLPSDQQQRVFRPSERGMRRVIVSTNIAATSVTVQGVVYVVDSGFVKQQVYNPRTGLDSLEPVPIAKSEAIQRCGRAGRTSPGECYRLYSEAFYDGMKETTVPEIQRTSLTSVILNLKCLEISNVIEFQYLDPPHEKMILEALKQLYYFEAIDLEGRVTALGHQIVQFPLSPSLARVLLRSKQLQCQEAALPLVAMLSVENVFIRPNAKEQAEKAAEAHRTLEEAGGGTSDFATLLATYQLAKESGNQRRWCNDHYIHWRAINTAHSIHTQLHTILDHQPTDDVISDITDTSHLSLSERLRLSLCYGLFCNSARLAPGRRSFRTMDGHGTVAHIHPASALFGKEKSLDWVIYHEVVETARTYMRMVCPIRYSWIQSLLPRLHKVDVYRLSDCERRLSTGGNGEEAEEPPPAKRKPVVPREDTEALVDRVKAAKERYLARKRTN